MMSENSQVKVIAEIGVNHNGNLEKALELIDVAAGLKVDLIKFQTAIPELVQSPNSPKANYQVNSTIGSDSALEMAKSFHLPISDFQILKKQVESYGIDFFSTAFDLESLMELKRIGQRIFKIPSGEIDNWPLIDSVSKFADELLISTGLSNMNEIDNCLHFLDAKGFSRSKITIMQCDSAYPANYLNANINVLKSFREQFRTEIGYSDHTLNNYSAMAAIPFQIKYLEKHLTLNKKDSGPDHFASYDAKQFKNLIEDVRGIEYALGKNIKELSPDALENFKAVRRGIYYSKEIQKGVSIKPEDLILLRPINEFSPNDLNTLYGKKMKVTRNKFDPVESKDFE